MIRNHDRLFRRVFSQPHNAESVLRRILPRSLVARADWARLRLLPGGYIDTRLRSSEADLIYELPMRDSEAVVYVLFEHKSYDDPLTPLQLHGYVGDTWEQHFRSRRRSSDWPLVIAVVVYHGARPWRGATRAGARVALGELGEPEELRRFVSAFDFLVEDLTATGDAELRALAIAPAAHLVYASFQRCRRRTSLLEELRLWIELAPALPAEIDGVGTIQAVLSYSIPLHGLEKQQRGELDALLCTWVGTNDAEMLMKTLSSEWMKIGREEGHVELLVRLLRKRFGTLPDALVARIRAADQAQINTWAERLLEAPSLEAVFAE